MSRAYSFVGVALLCAALVFGALSGDLCAFWRASSAAPEGTPGGAEMAETIGLGTCPGCALTDGADCAGNFFCDNCLYSLSKENVTPCDATVKKYAGVTTQVCSTPKEPNKQMCQTGNLICWVEYNCITSTISIDVICSNGSPKTCSATDEGFYCRTCASNGMTGINQSYENDTCIACP